jgi:hypothetical protein
MIPPQFLPYILEILSYSFEDSEENFKNSSRFSRMGARSITKDS